MKLGVRNYVVDPTLTSKYGSDRAAWGVSAHARNITVCDFLLFLFSFFPFCFSLLHLAYRSPQWTHFHDLYVKRRVFTQGSAFWGSPWWIFTFTPFYSPKFENLHYGLWQLRTAITRPFLKIEASCLTKVGFFGVEQFNGVVEICLTPTLVTMVTNWWFSNIKLAKTQLIQEIELRIMHQTGDFQGQAI